MPYVCRFYLIIQKKTTQSNASVLSNVCGNSCFIIGPYNVVAIATAQLIIVFHRQLVSLLSSDKEHIVLSVVRTLRHLCVGVGYVPHARNQSSLAQSNGIRYLVALMTHSRDEVIQVEAAHTLGCAALGKKKPLRTIASIIIELRHLDA